MSTDLDTAVKFFRVIGTYARPLGGDLKLTLSPAWGRDTLTFAGAQAEAAGPFTSVVDRQQLAVVSRARPRQAAAERCTLDTGLDVLSRVTTYDALVPVDDNLINAQGVDIPPSQVFRGAAIARASARYVDLGIDVTTKLRLIPSLRLDTYIIDGQDRASIDPRLVARYQVDADVDRSRRYLGEFSQPPQPEALDARFGNPDVGIEHATHFGLGYEWKPDRLWTIDSEIYYARRRDVVVFTHDIVDERRRHVPSTVNFLNEGRRDSYGLEILIKREISERAFGWLSYTFSRAQPDSNRDGVGWIATAFDQPHVLNAVASWKPGSGLRARRAVPARERPARHAGDRRDVRRRHRRLRCRCAAESRSIRTPTFTPARRARREGLAVQHVEPRRSTSTSSTSPTSRTSRRYQYDYRYRESAPVTGFPILPTLGLRGTW